MKRLLILTTALALCSGNVLAAIESDITSGGVVETEASDSELGSKIEMIGNDFNLKAVQEAFDTAKDTENVAIYDYGLNKTYAVRMRVNMATMIVLPSWERVKAFSLADDLFFSVTNFDNEDMLNHLILQSNVAGVDTNLVVVGDSGQIYNFYLRNDPVDSPEVPHFTVYIKGAAPLEFLERERAEKAHKEAQKAAQNYGKAITPAIEQSALEKAKADYLNSLPDKDDIDLDYEISGDVEIAPRAVYSRHGWTFFDFRETLPSDRLPVLYKVVDGYDAVINSRMENGFLVAETISEEGWTLRNGDKVVCVKKQ